MDNNDFLNSEPVKADNGAAEHIVQEKMEEGTMRVPSSSQTSVTSEKSDTSLADDRSVISQKSLGGTGLVEQVSALKVRDRKEYIPFSTAHRKRYNKAIKEGLTREEALKKAKEGAASASTIAAEAKATTAKPSYSQVLSGVKLGVISDDPAKKQLSGEDLAAIKKAILEEMMENDGVERQPEFESINFKAGWLTTSCTNESTAKWVRDKFEGVKARCGLKIALVEQNEFPKTCVVNGYFGDSSSDKNESILALIQSQNNLPAKQWSVITRSTEGKMEHLVLGLDEPSYKALEEKGGRIAYKFGHIRMMLSKKRNADVLKTDSGEAKAKPVGEEQTKEPAKKPKVVAAKPASVGPAKQPVKPKSAPPGPSKVQTAKPTGQTPVQKSQTGAKPEKATAKKVPVEKASSPRRLRKGPRSNLRQGCIRDAFNKNNDK